MDFGLSDEQRLLCRTVFELGRELDEDLTRRDREGELSRDGWRRCGEIGLQGLPIGEEYGGGGADVVTTALTLESFGRGCRDEGLTFSICAHMQSCALPIAEFGSESQCRELLPALSRGELIGGNASSEPEAGSDVFSMATTAKRESDGYVLEGSKSFVTNGPVADLLVVYALTRPEYRQYGGVSAFLVRREDPGFEVGPPIPKIGLRTSPWCEIAFDGCRIPLDRRLGEEGAGAEIFTRSMEWERLLVSMTYLGRMEDTLERSLDYARTRRQFGRPIGKHQRVADRLVAMKARLEACRQLLYRAAWEKQTGGEEAALLVSLGKWLTSELRIDSATAAVQIHGGYGCTEELGIERELRNAVPATIASGTSEMQRALIARYLGL